jgi:transcriptional regulator with XRE-family HTH domain
MAGIGNDLVREARKRAGLTQAELAQLAGTTQSAIARIETGDSAPSFDSVLRLLRLCGLDLDIMLVPRDESDHAQAQRLTSLSPEERLLRHQRVLAQLREMRQAGARTRAAL